MSLENRTVGLIEDDPIMGESLVQRLQLEGASVRWWRTCADAMRDLPTSCTQGCTAAIICDIRLPDGSGADIYRSMARRAGAPPFLFITGYGDIEQAVGLMREGARDYLTKPFAMSTFLARLRQIIGTTASEGEAVLGISQVMRDLEQFLRRAARVNSGVLLTGETGVGKEVCARFLHNACSNASGPFMAVNCAAFPAELDGKQLFGHERGSRRLGRTHAILATAERAASGNPVFRRDRRACAQSCRPSCCALSKTRSFHRPGWRAGGAVQGAPCLRDQCRFAPTLSAKAGFREDLYYRINVYRVPARSAATRAARRR